ncbi:hypothetical protein BC830DRAFT_1092026 [Chytriomyces sp. MP71]|nr:hypothetical protein BC830DRAFT_1092026 [Chytriomyces sp. MP71]
MHSQPAAAAARASSSSSAPSLSHSSLPYLLQLPPKNTAGDEGFDPENIDATAPRIHRVPGVQRIVRLITQPTVIRSDSKIPFRIFLPSSHPPTIATQEMDAAETTSKPILTGTSSIVFVRMLIKNPVTHALDKIIRGREVILRRYRVFPPNMSDLVSIKYHVKEIDAFMLMNRFYNILPEIATGSSAPSSRTSQLIPKLLLKINDWNPAIKIISATCTWTETIRHNTTAIAETAAAAGASTESQTWLMNQLHNSVTPRSRTLLKSHVVINSLYQHSSHHSSHYTADGRVIAGGRPFVHEFPVPVAEVRASFERAGALVTVEHSVGLGIEFCVEGAESGALMLEFRRAIVPQFGFFGDAIVLAAPTSGAVAVGPIAGAGNVAGGSGTAPAVEQGRASFGGEGHGAPGSLTRGSASMDGGFRGAITNPDRKGMGALFSFFSGGGSAPASTRTSTGSVGNVPATTGRSSVPANPVSLGSSMPLPSPPRTTGGGGFQVLNVTGPMASAQSSSGSNPSGPKKFGIISVKPDDSSSSNFFNALPAPVPFTAAGPTTALKKSFGIISVKPDDSGSSGFFKDPVTTSPVESGTAASSLGGATADVQPKRSFGIISVKPDKGASTGFFQPVASSEPTAAGGGAGGSSSSLRRIGTTPIPGDVDLRRSSLTGTEVSVVLESNPVLRPGSLHSESMVSRESSLVNGTTAVMRTGAGTAPSQSVMSDTSTVMLDGGLQRAYTVDVNPYITLQNHTYLVVEENKSEPNPMYPHIGRLEFLQCRVGDLVTIVDIGEGDLMWCENIKTKQTGYVHVGKLDLTHAVELPKPVIPKTTREPAKVRAPAFDTDLDDDYIPPEILLESQVLAESGRSGMLGDDEIPESVLIESLKEASLRDHLMAAEALMQNAGGLSVTGASGSGLGAGGSSSSAGGGCSGSDSLNDLVILGPSWALVTPEDHGDREAVAVTDYLTLTSHNDLPVVKGDILVFNLRERKGHMLRGINLNSGKEGTFPLRVVGIESSETAGLGENIRSRTPVGGRITPVGGSSAAAGSPVLSSNDKGKAVVYGGAVGSSSSDGGGAGSSSSIGLGSN